MKRSRRGLRRESILLVILVVGVVSLLLTLGISTAEGIASIIALFVLIAVIDLVMSKLETSVQKAEPEERGTGRGAREEERENLFDSLSDDYLVLNGINSGHGNIDHVLPSETKGVFVIEIKPHNGQVTADGTGLLLNGQPPEEDFINQTLSNCQWFKEWIKKNLKMDAWVRGVVVFTNAFVGVRKPVRGVGVINKGHIQQHFEQERESPGAGPLWERRKELEALLARQADPSQGTVN